MPPLQIGLLRAVLHAVLHAHPPHAAHPAAPAPHLPFNCPNSPERHQTAPAAQPGTAGCACAAQWGPWVQPTIKSACPASTQQSLDQHSSHVVRLCCLRCAPRGPWGVLRLFPNYPACHAGTPPLHRPWLPPHLEQQGVCTRGEQPKQPVLAHWPCQQECHHQPDDRRHDGGGQGRQPGSRLAPGTQRVANPGGGCHAECSEAARGQVQELAVAVLLPSKAGREIIRCKARPKQLHTRPAAQGVIHTSSGPRGRPIWRSSPHEQDAVQIKCDGQSSDRLSCVRQPSGQHIHEGEAPGLDALHG